MPDALSTDDAPGAAAGVESGEEMVDGLLAALAGFASRASGADVREGGAEQGPAAAPAPRHTNADIRKCAPDDLCLCRVLET